MSSLAFVSVVGCRGITNRLKQQWMISNKQNIIIFTWFCQNSHQRAFTAMKVEVRNDENRIYSDDWPSPGNIIVRFNLKSIKLKIEIHIDWSRTMVSFMIKARLYDPQRRQLPTCKYRVALFDLCFVFLKNYF